MLVLFFAAWLAVAFGITCGFGWLMRYDRRREERERQWMADAICEACVSRQWTPQQAALYKSEAYRDVFS